PMYDVLVALTHGARFDARGIKARIRFGNAKAGACFTADNLWQPPFFLFFGAVLHYGMQPEDIDMHRGASCKCTGRIAYNLQHNRRFGYAQPRATVFWRDGNAQPTAFGDSLRNLNREGVRAVELVPVVVIETVAFGANGLAQGDSV